jgi:hypothetical protein
VFAIHFAVVIYKSVIVGGVRELVQNSLSSNLCHPTVTVVESVMNVEIGGLSVSYIGMDHKCLIAR